VNIDLSRCEWASALPMLLLATELATHSSPNRAIEINLGEGGSGEHGDRRARVRKFLALHGLLEAFLVRPDLEVRFQFDKLADHGERGVWFTRAQFPALADTLERAGVDLLYGTSIAIPATVWKVPAATDPDRETQVRQQVAAFLHTADK